jgi:hypothetical protein
MTLTPPPPPAVVPSWPLQQAGPAQFDWLIHFCGRAPGARMTPLVTDEIARLEPWQRLENILWEQRLLGFPPFGADVDQPMSCLSESPPDHLQWLLSTRQWPPWGLFFSRQYVYDIGGGPVWSVRPPLLATLRREHRPWAVRLDTTPGSRSDWLFEREWRIPLPAGNPALPLTTTNLVGVLIGDRNWQPSVREVETGYFRSGATGELVHPHEPHAQPDTRPELPALWQATALRIYWDPTTQQFGSATDAPAGAAQ